VALDDKNGKREGARGDEEYHRGRVLLYCSERLREGVVYPVVIKLPEKLVEMKGKVTWSNLDNCASLHFSPAMGFYFMRIDEEKDKQILREAILYQGKKASTPARRGRWTYGFPSLKGSGRNSPS